MKILVTGGLGYIGSHTCVELLQEGYEVVVLDNLSNSKEEVKEKIKEITGKEVKFYLGDMMDEQLLNNIFTTEKIDAVIDFAAYKAVGESVQKPIEYYMNNVSTVLVLLKVMTKHHVKKLVFSSSATVYGDPERVPIKENDKTGGTTNPYGTSKLFVEQILKDLYKADNTWDIAILRYFNPIGAHPSGLIGEEPNGIPANLMPYIAKVASKELECLSIFGNDYPTKDGTGVRDYIHVVDLAKGHIKALEKLEKESQGLYIYNLGTGIGYSVLDIVNAFEKVNHVKVNYKITNRRSGDIAECFADPTKAKDELGWEASLGIEDMCKDAYNFILKNKKD
jgi:UDP-glucose 4-epimerase